MIPFDLSCVLTYTAGAPLATRRVYAKIMTALAEQPPHVALAALEVDPLRHCFQVAWPYASRGATQVIRDIRRPVPVDQVERYSVRQVLAPADLDPDIPVACWLPGCDPASLSTLYVRPEGGGLVSRDVVPYSGAHITSSSWEL